jgi:hypothetical protein
MNLAALDWTNNAARQACPRREVGLPPSFSNPESPDGTTEPPTIHEQIVTRATSPSINRAR